MRMLFVIVLFAHAGCAVATPAAGEHPAWPSSGSQLELDIAGAPMVGDSVPSALPAPVTTPATILVTTDRELGRPSEVVDVLDFHSDARSEDKGFDELRAKAAALGADAVVAAEFEHADASGRSHLSGMAVRLR